MITTELIGGLGNQMFQYAAGMALAQHLGTTFSLDVTGFEQYDLRVYELSLFGLTPPIASKQELKPYHQWREFPYRRLPVYLQRLAQNILGYPQFHETHTQFHPEFFEQVDNTYIKGYWNSEKYFRQIKKKIRKEFTFPATKAKQVVKLVNQIADSEAISLHVRRGDYATVAKTNSFHGLCSLDYYQEALAWLESKVKKPTLYVFSDDKEWVKTNLKSHLPTVYVDHDGANFDDLRLMALCKHHVIANSTFSWWGAWLNPSNKKLVVAPKRWFRDPKIDTSDICPTSWTLL